MDMDKKHLSINSVHYKDQENVTTEEEESFRNSLFFGLFEDPNERRRRSGSIKRQYSDMGDNYHRIRKGDAGEERMDVRVLMLLEYFRELYVREIEVLKKVFPGGVRDEFVDFFKRIGEAISQARNSRERMEFRTIERSLSVGSPSRGFGLGSEVPIGNERFKVLTVNAGDSPGGGISGEGQTKK